MNPSFANRNWWRRWVALLWCGAALAGDVHHYVFFNQERAGITNASFLETKALEGAQLKYTWRELEPELGQYNFNDIRRDLSFLGSRGKRLFFQLQDASFDPKRILVPRYLLDDARYHGGADRQYHLPEDDETRAVVEGWVARRWDPEVQVRFRELLQALGREFDGKIEGINLPETSVSFGESGRLFPKGFTPAVYRDAVLTNMMALKRAFPKSVAMQYANFMPGEWLPGDDRSYLRSVYRWAQEAKVAVGGPDLLPSKPGQRNHSYPLIRECDGIVPAGIAVQDGNYAQRDPKTGQPITIAGLVAFATDELRVRYMFWCTEEPFYSQKLIPFLRSPN